MALQGRALVLRMFDRQRTGNEIARIYGHILSAGMRPPEFDSHAYVRGLQHNAVVGLPSDATANLVEVTQS
jgi:hypothetical protein